MNWRRVFRPLVLSMRLAAKRFTVGASPRLWLNRNALFLNLWIRHETPEQFLRRLIAATTEES